MDAPAVLSLRTVSVKQALDQIGYGRYHTFLLIMGCCFRAAEAMWVVGVTYLAEFLVDSTWNISDLQKACLVASLNAGSFLGGPVWGIISDNYGRTKAYLASAILAVIFGVICGASINFLMLAIIEFCAGFVMCGFTVANTLLAEFLPVEHRGRAIVTLQSSKIVGHIGAIILAWWLMENYSWRVYLYTCAGLFLIPTFSFFFLDESPRYLLLVDRDQEAFKVLNNVARKNGKEELSASFSGIRRTSEVLINGPGSRMFTEALKPLFDYTLRNSTLSLALMWMLACGFVYYGIIVLIPSYFSISGNLYLTSLISVLAEIVGFTFTVIIIDYAPRVKYLIVLTALTSILLFVLCFFINDSTIGTVLLIAARNVAACTYFVLFVYSTELYPTSSRNTAIGFLVGCGKFGNIVSSFTVEYASTSFSVAFIATSMALAFLLSLILSIETKDSMMPDHLSSPRAAKSPSVSNFPVDDGAGSNIVLIRTSIRTDDSSQSQTV